ncbi:MAG: CRISPR-associated endonuclease Cas2 [Candidatus Paceibacterota bacterium]|jgi:DNA-binding transcriptional regulator PaaX
MNKSRRYKGVPINSFGIPILNPTKEKIKDKIDRRIYHDSFSINLTNSSPKNLIVMYDIPHAQKKERDWFRRHLKKFGYIMIQKSVWVGPSPLQKDFLEYVKSIGLLGQLKSFKLAKSYTGKENLFK